MINKKKSKFFQKLQKKYSGLIEEYKLTDEKIDVKAKPLSPEDASGKN